MIEVRHITKTFSGEGHTVHALNDVSFKVNPGEIFGFVGANGAGKSTTMRIIMGVLTHDSGDVLLFDKPADQNARQNVGYMPAERGLYGKMRVFSQLVYFAQLHGISHKQAIATANDWLEKLDIVKYKNSKLDALSTGNQQRVQLAIALISQPKALILDEPFSGLDPIAVNNFSQIIRQQANNGVAVIFSSHQLELVDRVSDKIGIIKQGKIIEIGTPDELRKVAHEKNGAPLEVTMPTPLVDIFGELVAENA